MAFDTGISYAGPLASGDVGSPNQGNSQYLQASFASARPAAGNQGVTHYATDTGILSYDTGAAWVALGSPVRVVRKTANEDVSSTTLQNDDELLIAIGANEVWKVLFTLRGQALSGSSGIKTSIVLPSGGSIAGAWSYIADAVGKTFLSMSGTDGDLNSGAVSLNNMMVVIDILVVNGANAGNIQLQWACQAATTTRVFAGGRLEAVRLA